MNYPISIIKKKILNKEIKVIDIIEHYIKRIKKNKETNSITFLFEEAAIKQAKYWDKELSQKDAKEILKQFPLIGLPVAVKDNISIKGAEVRAASKILKGYLASFDATVIERLRNSGAIILAQSNCDEMAMGSSNESSIYGPVRNPNHLEYVSGGSSGGSAAAVAANLIPIGLGSDTGGSVRQPASWCGVFGLKPSYARVSRYGLFGYGSSLDAIGLLARYTEDIYETLKVIEAYDGKDFTLPKTITPLGELKDVNFLKGLKVAFLKDSLNNLSTAYQKNLTRFKEWLKSHAIEIQEVEIPYLDLYPIIYGILAFTEACSNYARYSGISFPLRDFEANTFEDMLIKTRNFFGLQVKRRLFIGKFFALKENYHYYLIAQELRRKITEAFKEAFKNIDIIISPTSLKPAFKVNEELSVEDMHKIDALTISQNLAGIPAISVPFLKDPEFDNLPLGLQLTSDYLREDLLLKFSYQMEQGFLK